MRILQVCPRYPPQTGGIETHVREVSERLVERGHQVEVHTADAGADGDRKGRQNGVNIVRHRSLSPGAAYYVAPGIATAVSRAGVDLVHAHNIHALVLPFAALGARDVPFAVTPHYHGSASSSTRNRLFDLYRPLTRRVLERADAVVAVTEWEREQLVSDFAVQPRLIPNGVHVDRFTEVEPEQRERPYLLMVGRLEAYKGVQHVVRALPELDEVDLVVAGEGPYAPELKSLVTDLGVADRVDFLGYVDDDRLARLYRGAAVVAALSTHESFGLTVAEALVSGTPCVVNSTGGLKAWSSATGVVGVASTDPEIVAAAIEEAVGLTPEPGDICDWSMVVDKLESMYRELTS